MRASEKRSAQRDRVLRDVVAELEQGDGTKAAQLFRDGIDHGLFPSGNGLPRWLIKTIGKDPAGKLVDAFAQFPCFYCKNGQEPCEVCDGHGTLAADAICEGCAGLGVTRCGFCDGSGWVANSVIPSELRIVVLVERVNRACGQVENLLRDPVPDKSSADPVEVAKHCAVQLLNLNRHLGVFENAVVASRELAQTHARSKEKLTKTVGMCCRVAAEAQVRMRELVRQMAVCARLQAEAPDVDSAVYRRARLGSAFYDSLSRSRTFSGTALEHPYLRRALAKLKRK